MSVELLLYYCISLTYDVVLCNPFDKIKKKKVKGCRWIRRWNVGRSRKGQPAASTLLNAGLFSPPPIYHAINSNEERNANYGK